MKKITLIIIVGISQMIIAQNPTFDWAKTLGSASTGTLGTYVDCITHDANNNIISAGQYSGTVDFDPGTSSYNLSVANQSLSMYIQKLDNSGNFIWAKEITYAHYLNIVKVKTDAAQNIILVGEFAGTVDFNPGTGIDTLSSDFQSHDLFILKLNSNGDFLWIKSVASQLTPIYVFDLAVDYQSNIIFTGVYNETTDFDPSSTTFNLNTHPAPVGTASDAYVAKLDSSGNLIWAENMGGKSHDGGYAITTDINGNIYTSGTFQDTADFDPTNATYNLIAKSGVDIFIQKLGSNGNLIWAKLISADNSNEICNALIVDAVGNVYATGPFTGPSDFDPDTPVVSLTSTGPQIYLF